MAAIIYSRISSLRQTTGHGIDRQESMALDYCKRQGLAVADNVSDVCSGFHAKQMGGALGMLVKAIEEGSLTSSDCLVVESLDRLGRENTYDALERFMKIVRSGVDVHEVSTGIVYSKASPHLLHIAFAVMERAHNESLMKSQRAKANHARRREQARTEFVTTVTPGWIDVVDNVPVLNEYHKTVQLIFKMYLNGSSFKSIAMDLNNQAIELIPRRGGKGSRLSGWTDSSIRQILVSKAVCGYYPTDHEIIPDYYPACISEMDFQRVEDIRTRKAVSKQKSGIITFLSGICKCSCGLNMISYSSHWQTNNEKKTRRGLRCSARGLNSCSLAVVDTTTIEELFLKHLPDNTKLSSMFKVYYRKADALRARARALRKQQDNLIALVEAGSGSAKERFFELQQECSNLEAAAKHFEDYKIGNIKIDSLTPDGIRKTNVGLAAAGVVCELHENHMIIRVRGDEVACVAYPDFTRTPKGLN